VRRMDENDKPGMSDGWKAFLKDHLARDPLPTIDPRDWQGKPVPEREWLVEGMIPHRTVTLFSGDGEAEKLKPPCN
jgi:hypothetical protein